MSVYTHSDREREPLLLTCSIILRGCYQSLSFELGESCDHRLTLQTLSKELSKMVKKGSPYSITERRVPELIPVFGSQPAGNMNHTPDGRLPFLSARPAVTPATLKRAATSFAAW